MFNELNANCPTLLCRFIAPDQVGQMLSAIFTCMCNYNTEICGMAMAQTIVPVYTIPNTYRVQQSLWESICRIIPSIACTSGSELHSFEPAAPHNTPVEQAVTVLAAGNSGVPKLGTAKSNDRQSSTALLSTHKKNATQEVRQTGVLLGIPPAGSVWVAKEAFQHIPIVNLADNGDPPGTRPQKTSTPIKTTPVADRSHSGKKLDISKIKGAHLLFEMQDGQEKAWERESEAKGQAVTSHRTAGAERGSGGELPARLPKLPNGEGTLTKPSNLAPEASSQGKKCPFDADNEVIEPLDHDEAAGPPKKKKKKKNKSKDRSKDETPSLEAQDNGACADNPMAEPEVGAKEPILVSAASGTQAEGTKVPKKKKKKSAELEKFQLEQREAKVKEMARAKHQKLQHDQDFKALQNYQKTLPADLLDTINGADHSGFLLGRLQKEGNYMNKKSGRKRNLMSVEHLLSWIAKYANELEKRLKEAHQMTRATFLMVQGMPSSDKYTLALVVHVLMDCEGNIIACDHSVYRKEQNIGLHNVVSPAAMAQVTATETYIMDGVPTRIKADYAYYPFCSYACSNHRAINNHVRMHFRAILMCGWPSCYFVHMQSKKMIEHSAEVHDMARAQPAQEKGGD